jgi:hypothetical protein
VAVGVGGDIVWAEGFGWADLEHLVPVAPEHAVQDRHRLEGAHFAAVGLLLEKAGWTRRLLR